MIQLSDLNIEPIDCPPRTGAAHARKNADRILMAYMCNEHVTVDQVANAFGLPYHAVREIISDKTGSVLHTQLANRLLADIEERREAEIESRRTYREDGKEMCGARTRAGRPCRAPAKKNGRCRMHGGESTGPRTSEGRQRIAEATRLRNIEKGRRNRLMKNQATEGGHVSVHADAAGSNGHAL